ncbi:MAG: class I SAM-dependent methyltransferase [Burkholderiaceae bacterium]
MVDYAQSTHHSRQRMRRFSHVRRFERALELLRISDDDSVLDLGAGDGYFLQRVADSPSRATLVAVEPDPGMQARLRDGLRALIDTGRIRVYTNGDDLPEATFDRLVCLEVMEHLPARLQRSALALLDRVARSDARLVISVPIEVGPVALIKALARWRNGEPTESWGYLLNAVRGKAVPRPDNDYIINHTGFRFKDLEQEIEQSPWKIERREFSPLQSGSWLINSQVLYVLHRRAPRE